MAWFGIKHQNLGAFLENKVHWKSKLSKYGINKSLSPIFVFFNEIFFVKIWLIFDIEKWLWKSEFCYIWPSIPNQAPRLFNNYVRTLKNSRNLNTSKQTIRWKWEDQILQEATTRMKYWHLKTKKGKHKRGILASKKMIPATLFSFQLRIKTKNKKANTD